MSNKKSCKTKLSDKCAPMQSSDCVDYVGELYPSNTSLDPDDCNTVTDVIEDIINILDQHTDTLDFSDFGCCIEYEVSNEEDGLTLKDVLSTHETMLCDHEERITKLENGEANPNINCNSCDEGCDETDGCCTILKLNDTLSQVLSIDQVNWVKSSNSALNYKADKSGTYKIVLELVETSSVLSNQQAFIGISLNGLDPDNDLYSQVKLTPIHPKTINFIVKMKINDTLRVAYKRGTTAYELEYIKMIVEKVK